MDIFNGILIAIVLILIWEFIIKKILFENYKSKEEKAKTIATWWESNKNRPSYRTYKVEVPKSDIVEYIAVKKLGMSGGNIDEQKVFRVIS